MKRRMLALLLMLCMVVSLLPAQMVVAEGTATDLDLDANQLGTFTPDTSGTYVFYDTNSQNENSSEWSIWSISRDDIYIKGLKIQCGKCLFKASYPELREAV